MSEHAAVEAVDAPISVPPLALIENRLRPNDDDNTLPILLPTYELGQVIVHKVENAACINGLTASVVTSFALSPEGFASIHDEKTRKGFLEQFEERCKKENVIISVIPAKYDHGMISLLLENERGSSELHIDYSTPKYAEINFHTNVPVKSVKSHAVDRIDVTKYEEHFKHVARAYEIFAKMGDKALLAGVVEAIHEERGRGTLRDAIDMLRPIASFRFFDLPQNQLSDMLEWVRSHESLFISGEFVVQVDRLRGLVKKKLVKKIPDMDVLSPVGTIGGVRKEQDEQAIRLDETWTLLELLDNPNELPAILENELLWRKFLESQGNRFDEGNVREVVLRVSSEMLLSAFPEKEQFVRAFMDAYDRLNKEALLDDKEALLGDTEIQVVTENAEPLRPNSRMTFEEVTRILEAERMERESAKPRTSPFVAGISRVLQWVNHCIELYGNEPGFEKKHIAYSHAKKFLGRMTSVTPMIELLEGVKLVRELGLE